MLRNLGRLIWTHQRDMTVLNYPAAIVYEIYTADGYVYLKHDKQKNNFVVDKVRPCPASEIYDVSNDDKSRTYIAPHHLS
jgi:hypothetical protein